MNPKMQAAIHIMKANMHRKLPISELASSVRLSQSRLWHLFITELGISPLKYLKSLRLERASELLETSLLGIKEIAAKVGYNDDSHFMRDFKKFYGCTPSQHRAQYFIDKLFKYKFIKQDKRIG